MTPVKFTHTNRGTEMTIYAEQVAAIDYLPTQTTNVLLFVGGAMLPVKGTQEEINRAIQEALSNKATTKKEPT